MATSNPSSTFTRPNNTTAYASGNLVANSTTAGSVVPMSWTLGYSVVTAPVRCKRVRLQKSGTSVTNATFRLHLYGASPTVANGDGGAWSTDTSANYLGYFDITQQGATLLAFTDGCAGWGAFAAGGELNLKLGAGKTIYGLLEARAAYAPAANEAFSVTPELIEDGGSGGND
jgi:hypothetical protein